MKLSKVLVPGSFEDAFVYMQRLFLLHEDRSLHVVSLDNLTSYIENKYPDLVPIPTLMFSRNDWLASSQLTSMLSNKDIRKSLLDTFDRYPPDGLTVSENELGSDKIQLKIQVNSFLDMQIYNSRVYLATDKGLYNCDLDLGYQVATRSDIQRRNEAKCLNAIAKYGTVIASCGNQGLFGGIDEFGWAGKQKMNSELKAFATKSYRSSWLGYNVVNYESPRHPVLLHCEKERVNPSTTGPERERVAITNIIRDGTDLETVFTGALEEYNLKPESIQHLHNSTSVLFINTSEGKFYGVGLRIAEDGSLQAQYAKPYQGPPENILTVKTCAKGLMVETESKVFLFSHGNWIEILDSEVISIQSFPNSKRYKNLAAITVEQGVLLVGCYDESNT